jgi:hypothetical protein
VLIVRDSVRNHFGVGVVYVGDGGSEIWNVEAGVVGCVLFKRKRGDSMFWIRVLKSLHFLNTHKRDSLTFIASAFVSSNDWLLKAITLYICLKF